MNSYDLYEKIPAEEFPIRLSLKDGSVEFLPHWHEYTEIHFAKRGSFNISLGNKSYFLEESDCVIVNANELHTGMGTNCDDFVIMIHPSLFDGNYVIYKHHINDDVVTELMNNILYEYQNSCPTSRIAIKGFTYQLIAHITRKYAVAELNEGNYKAFSAKYSTVNRAAEYINNHYFENITTGFLAEMVHLSQSHFCHIFKEVTGKSAKEYLMQVRIDKASDRLLNTEMNITEIAFSCGFFDANYFARAFRKVNGINPTEYKKRNPKKEIV